MNAVPTRDELFEMAARPIGAPGEKPRSAAARTSKIWLPAGKRSATSADAKSARAEFRERQIDLEDAIEAAGGQRGHLGA